MEKKVHFVICINNKGYEASLERMKVYKKVGHKNAGEDQLIRVIDESGEDYLYPYEFFAPIQLPQTAKEAMTATR